MSRRVYVAGPTDELDRVCAVADTLERAGHRITCRWWMRVFEARRLGWMTDADVPRDYLELSVAEDLDGIDSAEVVVAVCRRAGGISSGVAFELGVAEALGRRIVVLGDPRAHLVLYGDQHRGTFDVLDGAALACVEAAPT